MGTRAGVKAGLVGWAVLAAVSTPAQAESGSTAARLLPSQRSTFAIVAPGLNWRAHRWARSNRSQFYGTADLGWMKNVGAGFAAGTSAFVGMGEDYTRIGIKPRLRRWLSRKVSLDLSPGIVYPAYEEWDPERSWPGFVGEVSIGIEGLIGVSGQFEAVQFEDSPDLDCDCPPVRWTQRDWYLGVRPRSGTGVLIMSLAAGVTLFAFGFDGE